MCEPESRLSVLGCWKFRNVVEWETVWSLQAFFFFFFASGVVGIFQIKYLEDICIFLEGALGSRRWRGRWFDGFDEFWLRPMKNFYWFKQISNNGKSERRLSLGEYKRAMSWSKYLVSSGASIKGEGEEEWSADMSQLFIGSKFASGRHSRIYRGIYKQRDVAIKLISQPEEDENLAVMLEKQFISEVALLFRLRHPNIITVSSVSWMGCCMPAFLLCSLVLH